ncbi:unnamed protein product [Pedinophyceae sp. YPF-701]|nr:unnamed protein product [Pedinophyceae sp. YPF-701]
MDTFERERTTKGLRLPHGWCECPEMGAPIDDGFGPLIPCKVPLGRQWVGCVPSSVHFSPQAAVDLAFTSYNVVIGLVVDLTYSDKYYMPQEFVQLGCNYWKEPCRGRNASPDPKAVNSVCHIITQQQADPDFVFEDQVSGEKRKMGVLIHCTHGFNRTGFVVTALLHRRRLAGKLVPLGHTLQIFSQKRFPGIYKDQYVSDLFDYFHEDRPEFVRTPDLPQWKASARGVDDEDDDGGISVEQLHRDAETPRRNGIPFLPDGSPDLEEVGEDVPDELAGVIQRLVWSKVRGNELGQADDAVRFPGSQPVSLERDHVGNITADEYNACAAE